MLLPRSRKDELHNLRIFTIRQELLFRMDDESLLKLTVPEHQRIVDRATSSRTRTLDGHATFSVDSAILRYQ